MFRVGDVAPAGELIALLPVLAAALPVGLASNRAVAALGFAEAPGREYEVDRPQRVLHAVGMMFDAAGVKQKARLRLAPPLGGLAQRALGDAAYLGRACRRPLFAVFRDLLETDG